MIRPHRGRADSPINRSVPHHTRGPLGWHRKILTLAGPMMVTGVTVPLVGLVDTAVIGRLPEPGYLGAVAVGATVFNAILWMFGFLRMGTTALCAQARGSGDAAELYGTVCRAVVTALVLAAVVLSLQRPLFDIALHLLDATPVVETWARSYCGTRIWGIPAVLLNLVILGALFGLQDVRSVLLLGVLLNMTNVVLDLCFVLLLGWDVQGVAAGTAISEWLAACTGLARLRKHAFATARYHAHWRSILDRTRLKALFGVNRDLILRSLLVQLPFFVFTAVGARFGDTVLAANAILIQLFFFMAFGLNSFAHVSESLVGHAVGARNPAEMRAAAGYTLFWSFVIAVCVSAIYLLAGHSLIDMLTDLEEVQSTARRYLPWMIVMPLLAAAAFQFDGIYVGAAQTRQLRNTMLVSVLGFVVSLGLTLGSLGNHGLWLALTIFLTLRAVMLGVCYPVMARHATTRAG